MPSSTSSKVLALRESKSGSPGKQIRPWAPPFDEVLFAKGPPELRPRHMLFLPKTAERNRPIIPVEWQNGTPLPGKYSTLPMLCSLSVARCAEIVSSMSCCAFAGGFKEQLDRMSEEQKLEVLEYLGAVLKSEMEQKVAEAVAEAAAEAEAAARAKAESPGSVLEKLSAWGTMTFLGADLPPSPPSKADRALAATAAAAKQSLAKSTPSKPKQSQSKGAATKGKSGSSPSKASAPAAARRSKEKLKDLSRSTKSPAKASSSQEVRPETTASQPASEVQEEEVVEQEVEGGAETVPDVVEEPRASNVGAQVRFEQSARDDSVPPWEQLLQHLQHWLHRCDPLRVVPPENTGSVAPAAGTAARQTIVASASPSRTIAVGSASTEQKVVGQTEEQAGAHVDDRDRRLRPWTVSNANAPPTTNGKSFGHLSSQSPQATPKSSDPEAWAAGLVTFANSQQSALRKGTAAEEISETASATPKAKASDPDAWAEGLAAFEQDQRHKAERRSAQPGNQGLQSRQPANGKKSAAINADWDE